MPGACAGYPVHGPVRVGPEREANVCVGKWTYRKVKMKGGARVK